MRYTTQQCPLQKKYLQKNLITHTLSRIACLIIPNVWQLEILHIRVTLWYCVEPYLMSLGRDDRWLNSIRNPKSKTVLIFYSQKTINTLVKSQYISIHLVSFSRVKWQWITSILLLQNITIAQTYQISIHVDYMFSTCWYTLGTNTFSTCCNNPKKY